MSHEKIQSLELYSNFSSSAHQHQNTQATNQISRVTSKVNLKEAATTQQEPSYDNFKEIGNEYHINLSYLIGQGNFGKVYIGYKITEQNRPVACKVFEGELKDQQQPIVTEFKCMKKMENMYCPYIVKVHSIKKTKQAIYMFMDLCEGGNLNKFIQKKGYIGQLQSIAFFKQICKGFQTLYENNIFLMHRDLKPENILIHEGICKIADFGLCKIFDNSNEINQVQHHTLVGTPPYMSPQILRQFINKQQKSIVIDITQAKYRYSSKCDIWSLGIIFYEMLTGKLPWQIQRNNLEDYLNQIENTQLYIPDQWHTDIKDLIQKMLQVDEEQRISWVELFQHPLISKSHFKSQYNKYNQELLKFQMNQITNNNSNNQLQNQLKQQIQSGKQALQKLHEINKLILNQDKVMHFNKQVQLDSYSFQIQLSKNSSDFITYENFQKDTLQYMNQNFSNRIFNSQFYHHSDEEDEDYYMQYPEPPIVKKVKTCQFGDSVATNDTENQQSQYQQNLHAFQKKQQEDCKLHQQKNNQQYQQQQQQQLQQQYKTDSDMVQMMMAKIRLKNRELTYELNICQFIYSLFTEIFDLFKIKKLEFQTKMIDQLILYLVKYNIFKMKKITAEIQKFINSNPEIKKNIILQNEIKNMISGFDIVYFFMENQFNFYIYLYQQYNLQQQQEPFFYQKSEPFLNKNFNFDDNNILQLKQIIRDILQELVSELSNKIKNNLVPLQKKPDLIKVFKYVHAAVNSDQEFKLEEIQYDQEDASIQQFFDFYEICENLSISDDLLNQSNQVKQQQFGQYV